MALENVYLVGAQRTAIGAFHGSLQGHSAPQLGALALQAVLTKTGVPPESIGSVILGCVLAAGAGQAPARQAVIGAKLPYSTQAVTINKVCSSGLKAVMMAAQEVMLGVHEAVIAGGMESMTQAPYLLPAMRSGARLGHTQAYDSLIYDALWDVYNNFHMGNAAELCATENQLSREEQDAYATQSYQRALTAIAEGWFQEEIFPVTVREGKTERIFQEDEEPGRAKLDKFSTLKPAFDKAGTVTAANASSINDGAAAMLVCSEGYLERYKLEPLARLVENGFHAQAPEWFTTAPVGAIEHVLSRAQKKMSDIDLFEINEAFSAVSLACARKLSIEPERLNICGGAVALGHPVGASGARILTTLLHSLKRLGKKTGVAAICNGGGEATAVVVERP